MFLYHLRHAVRRLVHEPAFTLPAILTLALGVGANVAVFTVVEAVLLRPLPYPEAERLVTVNHRDERTGLTKQDINVGDFVDLAARQSAFEAFGAYGEFPATVYGGEEPYRVSALAGTADLLRALRVRPVLGRTLEPEDSHPGAAPVMMISYALWQGRFGGNPNVIGRSLTVGDEPHTIVGVAPPTLRFPPTDKTDVILARTFPLEAPAERRSGWTYAVGRLKPGLTVADAESNLKTLSRQMESEHPQSNQGATYYALPLRDALVGNTKPALVLMLAAVAVVLLIACVNVANLLLARSLGRRREIAVRMALGAGRGRLAAQLLSESLVLAVVASVAGLIIAHWGAHGLVALVPRAVSVPGLEQVNINVTVLAFALLLTVVTTLAFGLVALLTVRGEQPAGVLIGGARATMSSVARRATSALVVVEVAFAVVLLLGAGLILRSFASLMAVDPGFRAENVMTMSIALPADRYKEESAREAFYNQAFAALRALPDVRAAGAAAVVPLTGNNWTVSLQRPEHPTPAGQRPPEVGWQAATGGYFSALQIPLIAGRLFDERERPGGRSSVIISEAAARRYFPEGSAVGHHLVTGDGQSEIIGVVGSIRRAALRDDPRADMYFPLEQNPQGQTTLFVRTAGKPAAALASMQRTLKAVEPNIVFVETLGLADVASESVRVTQLVLWLLGIFAGCALVLAIIGIYGVMSYVVRQRTREIGTRIALGAQEGNILWLVMREGAAIAVLGAAAGVITGIAAARFLASILYATSTSDAIVLVGAPLVLIVATLGACWLPARRAASVDPARTLAE